MNMDATVYLFLPLILCEVAIVSSGMKQNIAMGALVAVTPPLSSFNSLLSRDCDLSGHRFEAARENKFRSILVIY